MKNLGTLRLSHKRFRALTLSASLLSGLVLAQPSYAGVIDRPFLRANAVVIVFGADDFSDNGGQGGIVTDFLLLNTVSGSAATDLIAANGVTTRFGGGNFIPIRGDANDTALLRITDPTFGGEFNNVAPNRTLDFRDSFNAFGLDDATDIDHTNGGNQSTRFFVASNTPFDIYGSVSNIQRSGDFGNIELSDIRYRLRVQTRAGAAAGANRWGVDAQDPSIGGAGVVIGSLSGPRTTLDALDGPPVKVFDGGQKTARRDGTILSQAVSFQSRYNIINSASYDLSQGIGSFSVDVTYTVFTP